MGKDNKIVLGEYWVDSDGEIWIDPAETLLDLINGSEEKN